MIMPFDIVRVLTAAAPIVASVASMANNKDSKPEIVEKQIERQETPAISINITNHFHGIPEKEAMQAATQVQNDMVSLICNSGKRYII